MKVELTEQIMIKLKQLISECNEGWDEHQFGEGSSCWKHVGEFPVDEAVAQCAEFGEGSALPMPTTQAEIKS